MPFPPTQEKKPGLMIAVGVPKEPPRMGAPGSRRDPPPAPEDEAAEPPAEEAGESDYSARFLSDMMQPLVDAGMSDDDARSTLADMLSAAAKCLRGGTDAGTVGSTEETDRTRAY